MLVLPELFVPKNPVIDPNSISPVSRQHLKFLSRSDFSIAFSHKVVISCIAYEKRTISGYLKR